MRVELRKTGIDALGDVPWGTHFCQFYRTKQDLIEILVPYFKAGLEGNEFCMWVTSAPLSAREARRALAAVVPDLAEREARGQIEFLPYTDWYVKDGVFEQERVLGGWVTKLDAALARGFVGLRLTGNTFWLERKDWASFATYEAAVTDVIGRYRMMALCTYSQQKCTASDVLDVVRNHEYALMKDADGWSLLERTSLKSARAALELTNARLQLLSETAGLLLSTDTPERIVDAICRKVMAHLDCDVFFNYLADGSGKRLRLNAFGGVPAEVAKAVEWLDFGSAVCGCAARDAARVVVEDIQHNPDERAALVRSMGMEAYAAHPLVARGRVMGTLSFGTRSRTSFAPHELELMRTVADQVASAMERKRADEALRESEGRLQTVVENLSEGLVVSDLEGNIYHWNRAALDMHGFATLDECRRKLPEFAGIFELSAPDGRVLPVVEWPLSRILRGERVRDMEVHIRRLNGDWRRVFSYGGSLVRDASGNPLIAVVTVNDITERNRSQEALRASEERYRTIVETAQEGIAIGSPDGKFVFVNQRMADLLGYTREELIGRVGLDFMDPEQVKLVLASRRELAAGGVIRREYKFRRKDGAALWTLSSATPLFDAKGRHVGNLGMHQDITERKLAEERLVHHSAVQEAMLSVLEQSAACDTEETLGRVCLAIVEKLTGSKFGFLGEVDSQGRLNDVAISNPGWEACRMEDQGGHGKLPTRLAVHGLYRRVIQDGQAWFTNDPAHHPDSTGTPPGHPPLSAFLGVPLVRGGNTVGMIGLGNREGGYRPEDQEAAAALAPVIVEALDRKRAQVAMAHLASFPQRNPMPVIELDRDGNVKYANPAAVAALPDLQEKGLAHPFLSGWATLANLLRSENVDHLTREIDVGDSWFEQTAVYLPASQEFRLYARDVTTRTQAEQALRESEERLKRAQEIAHLGSWELELGTNRLTWSDEVYRIFGLRPQQFSATYEAFLDRVHPDDRAAVDAAYTQSVARGDDGYEIEHRVVRASTGEIRYVHERCQHVREADGKTVRSIGMVHDITERKQAEAALRESEERYRSLAERSRDIVWRRRFYPSPAQEYVNPVTFEVLGYTPEEWYADPDLGNRITHPDDRDWMQRMRTQPGVVSASRDIRYRHKDGHWVWCSIHYWPVYDASGRVVGVAGITRDVTESKRAETALRETRDYLENLINYANAPIIVWDPSFRITRFNRAFERLTGRSASEVVGKGLELLFPESTREQSMEYIRQAVAGQHWEAVEIPILHIDGAVRTVLWNSATLFDSDGGSPVATIAQGQDITERKEVEQALLRERDFTGAVIDSLPGFFYAIDQDGTFVRCNRDAVKATGYTAEELKGLPWHTVIAEKHREYVGRQVAEVFSRGYSSAEANLRTKSGVEIPYYFTGARAMIGQSTYLLGMGLDMAERVRAEEALRETRDYLENLINYANAPIIVWNPEFKITRFNHAFERLTGLMAESVLGKTLDILFPDSTREQSMDLIRQAVAGRRWEAVEIPILHIDGAVRTVLWNSATLFAPDGVTVEATIAQGQDITERKQAEEEVAALNEALRRRAAELEAANKELEAFTYSVSHDLRAPLRAITGFSRILGEEHAPSLQPEAQRYLRMVSDNAEQMGRLIDDLLSLSRLGRRQLEKRAIRPAELARQALEDLAHEQEGRKLQIAIGNLPECEGDPVLLKQVFVNLLSNAIKYTRGRETAVIEVGWREVEGQPEYFVRDNGVGFDMRYVDKLFGVFQRLHRQEEYEGTGVGLAIVKRIVERHGGRARAEGEPDKGATFSFTLPRNAAGEAGP